MSMNNNAEKAYHETGLLSEEGCDELAAVASFTGGVTDRKRAWWAQG